MGQTSRDVVVQRRVTPTTFTGAALEANDAIHTGAIKIEHVTNGYDKLGSVIVAVQITDLDIKDTDLTVHFFAANPSSSTITAGAALDIHDTDLLTHIGFVPIVAADYADFADNSVAHKTCYLPFELNESGVTSADNETSIWAVLKSDDTDTFTTATALTLTVFVHKL